MNGDRRNKWTSEHASYANPADAIKAKLMGPPARTVREAVRGWPMPGKPARRTIKGKPWMPPQGY